MSSGSVNKVILIGHLGADPDLQYTPSGKAVAKLSVATNQRWIDPSGNPQQRTDWHRVVAWDRLAETCAKYLAKGRQVFVEGRLQNRSYDDKDGNKRYICEVVAHHVQFLSGGADKSESAARENPRGGEGHGSGSGSGRRGPDRGARRGGSQVPMDNFYRGRDDFGQEADRDREAASSPEPGDPGYNDALPF